MQDMPQSTQTSWESSEEFRNYFLELKARFDAELGVLAGNLNDNITTISDNQSLSVDERFDQYTSATNDFNEKFNELKTRYKEQFGSTFDLVINTLSESLGLTSEQCFKLISMLIGLDFFKVEDPKKETPQE